MTALFDSISKPSSSYFIIAFALYCVAFLLFVLAIAGKVWSGRDPEQHQKRWGAVAFAVAVAGFVFHLLFFFTRWHLAGHIPTSNMYEFMTFLGMMIVFAFLIVFAIYRKHIIGAFALPVAIIILAYAAVFPQEIQPLIPALQSYWLKIHVTTAATGEAFFAVGFAGGLMHLLRTVNFKDDSKTARREKRWLEFTIFFIILIVAFIGSVFTWNATGYKAVFTEEITVPGLKGAADEVRTVEAQYVLPPIFKPHDGKIVEMKPWLGIEEPLFEAPSWLKGASAGRKLNTVVWSLVSGLVLYGLLRLIVRRPLAAFISPMLKGMDPEDLDEIAYRSIAIGYPIFTLGALIFAMIWAAEAWGRFWGWDPKEVWALITWLFYAAYLHFRLSRGWQGKRSSWLAVIGFLVVMFTLIGVNLVIAGLHSYAGV
ncbi:cytochrome c biogenesis protein CcsA [Paenibacillus cymbidii]|uniref:cytochrome c biogenesis protein CcsA n=1 Tax=Paenibacillus cymbidii TaxID=1639034 RepID=UPI002E256DDA